MNKNILVILVLVFLTASLGFAQVQKNDRPHFKTKSYKSLNLKSLDDPLTANKVADKVADKVVHKEAWLQKVDAQLLLERFDGKVSKKLNKATSKARVAKKIGKIFTQNGVRKAGVLIKVESGSVNELSSQPGFELRRVSPDGTIAIGYLNIANINSIAKLNSVKRIDLAKYHKSLNKDARLLSKVDQVHSGLGNLKSAYKGNDVVVGVLDSGIDFDNADFTGANGTRIQFLLEYAYDENFDNISNVWTKAQIDANSSSVTQKDGYGSGGHGTHVSGIAAGNGSMNADFTGMAPEADIIFVKADRSEESTEGFSDDDILDGISFIFEKAESLGKPAVVNLSLGGNSGPRDGTSLFEQFMTQLQGKGKIIVAAAGNEGFDYIHTGVTTTGDSKVYAALDIPYDDISFDKEVWFDAGTISQYKVMALDIESGDEIASTAWLNVGTHNQNSPEGIRLFDTSAGYPAGFVYHDSDFAIDENNGDQLIQFYIYDGYDADSADTDVDYAIINEYDWAIAYKTTSTAGRIDAISVYASSYPEELSIPDATFLIGDQEQSLGTPASANGVISVGAYVSKNSWTSSSDNSTYQVTYPRDFFYEVESQAQVGEIAYFSSRGPTRDGRVTPVVAAPGDIIFSVRSKDIDDEDLEKEVLVESGNYIGYQGTSMASPHVAGVIALMLEAAGGNLDYDDIVGIFAKSSVKDSFTGLSANQTNNIFGNGKLDALAAVKEAELFTTSIESEQIVRKTELMQNYPNPFNPSTEIVFNLAQAGNVSIQVFDVLGRKITSLIDNKSYSAGRANVLFNASSLSSGLYFYKMQVQQANGTLVQDVKSMTLIK